MRVPSCDDWGNETGWGGLFKHVHDIHFEIVYGFRGMVKVAGEFADLAEHHAVCVQDALRVGVSFVGLPLQSEMGLSN